MATGIKITNATYGVGSKTVDVKAGVISHIKEGELNLIVSSDSLGVDDPAPGQTKQLTVSYTINDGSVNTKSAYDNEAIIISAPPERVASGLDIVKAQYGYAGNMTDVTDAIRNYIRDGMIKLKISPDAVGIPDPNPNKQKVLEVDYTLNGSKNSESIKDNQFFSVSAPPATGTSGGEQSIGTQIGWAILWTLVYALLFGTAAASYQYGLFFYPTVAYLFAALVGIPIVVYAFMGNPFILVGSPVAFGAICLFAMVYPFYSGSKLAIVQNVNIPFRPIPPITV